MAISSLQVERKTLLSYQMVRISRGLMQLLQDGVEEVVAGHEAAFGFYPLRI